MHDLRSWLGIYCLESIIPVFISTFNADFHRQSLSKINQSCLHFHLLRRFSLASTDQSQSVLSSFPSATPIFMALTDQSQSVLSSFLCTTPIFIGINWPEAIILVFISICNVPAGSPSRGGDVTAYVLINRACPLFILLLCLFLSLWPFDFCISFHKFSQQLSTFSLYSSGLISALLVLSTIYLFLKASLSPDVILCGWLGLKHRLTHWLTNHLQRRLSLAFAVQNQYFLFSFPSATPILISGRVTRLVGILSDK